MIKGYLVLYNLASAAAWAGVLYQTALYLSQSPSTITKISTSTPSWLPSSIAPYWKHATGTYGSVGELTKWVQTGAALEVLHSLLGFVRSPVQTTAMQVASRLYLVWGIADRFASVSTPSPLVPVNCPNNVYHVFLGSILALLRNNGSLMVDHRMYPLPVLRTRAYRLGTRVPTLAALHDVLRALSDRSGF